MVEKLKAKLGLNGQLAALMRQQHDEHSLDSDDEEEENGGQTEGAKRKSANLLNEEPDEYDREFIKMKEDCQKTRQARMIEELEKIRHLYEECKKNLGEKRKQVCVVELKVELIEPERRFQVVCYQIEGRVLEKQGGQSVCRACQRLPESALFGWSNNGDDQRHDWKEKADRDRQQARGRDNRRFWQRRRPVG